VVSDGKLIQRLEFRGAISVEVILGRQFLVKPHPHLNRDEHLCIDVIGTSIQPHSQAQFSLDVSSDSEGRACLVSTRLEANQRPSFFPVIELVDEAFRAEKASSAQEQRKDT
jgi:hypothetical protein